MEIRFKRPWYMKVVNYLVENSGPIIAAISVICAMVATSVLVVKGCNDHMDEVDKHNASTTYYCEYVDKNHSWALLVFKGPEKGVYMDTTNLHLGSVNFNGKVAKYFEEKDSWEWRRLAKIEDAHKIIKFYKFKKQIAKKQGKESEAKAAHRHHRK